MSNLKELLDEKRCFKLICGAGNQNLFEIERIVAVYAKAGCYFFDLAADEKVLQAAQKGLDFSVPKEEQNNYHFCISIGTKNDQHVQKARIHSENCKRCEQCMKICPQKAINQFFKVIKSKCIGCLKCKSVCKHSAIEIYSENNTFDLSTFRPFNISCVELHANDTDELEVDEIWNYLNENFDGMLSLCIGRQKLNDGQILERIKRLVAVREPYTTIIQADGIPISGVNDDLKTTTPAVEMGALVQSLHLPFYLILSGGTNSKTSELAKFKNVAIDGIGFGSYARNLVKEYTEKDNFFEKEGQFNQAVSIASKFIKTCY